MGSRREFIKSVTAFGVAGMVGAPAANSVAQTLTTASGKTDDRSYWLAMLDKVSTPVLENLARRELKKMMPVEAANPKDRSQYTHLEAFGRLLAGIAPWLAAQNLNESETKRQKGFTALAQASLDAATDPNSPDFMNFRQGGQPLVDAAFLAQGILRAPTTLWELVELRVQQQIIAALKSTREIGTPTDSNWVMFTAMIEAALLMMHEKTIEDRFEGSIRRMLGWYDGDGAYGDGEFFHWDYYNSFVIQPMLLDTLVVLQQKDSRFEPVYKTVLQRARRYAEILERFIAPDGTFPSLGRSTTYRFGALQSLAQIALRRELPERVNPAQVRCAMTAVIRKMMEVPGTFDEQGWLQIGFCGHQPSLAEWYISTGSLYLCSAAFLPLGLPPTDEFWKNPAAQWTQQRIWSGQNVPADHAIHDVKKIEVPVLNRSH
jgi:hypothetical protein